MVSVVRETFDERVNKYIELGKSTCTGFLMQRLNYMPIERLAYLLATDDKFDRIGCAEYECDDDSEKQNEPDPLGRKVDPWGRLMSNYEQTNKNYFY